MPVPRGVAQTVTYTAFDYTNNVPKTADAANHTLRLVRDGVESTPTDSPTQVDATNLPGIYKVTLTAAEMDAELITLGGKSSTSGVSLIPETFSTE